MAGRFQPDLQAVPEVRDREVRPDSGDGGEENRMNTWIQLQQSIIMADADLDAVGLNSLFRHLVAAVIFSIIGIAVLFLCVWIFDRFSPYSFRKEICEDQNTALGIIVGALLIGMSIIIAAAIHG